MVGRVSRRKCTALGATTGRQRTNVDDTLFFTLDQVYVDLLLKMGEKYSGGDPIFGSGWCPRS
jgi:hypothetical protein